MPAPLKLLLPNKLVMITSRTEVGLPFVATIYMNLILWGILARAQALYPVKVVAFLFMANHLHLLAVVKEPDDLVAFMDRVKTESAHAINHLLGRRRRTVWQSGFDAPTILTLEDAIDKLVYIYTNPQSAHLVDSIDNYPGVSSWQMFTQGQFSKTCKVIRRPSIQPLSDTALSTAEQETLARRLSDEAILEETFTLSPDLWLDCYSISDPEKVKYYNDLVLKRVREREDELRSIRAKSEKTTMGEARLAAQAIDQPYTPTKFGRRMWCICWDKALRKSFIAFVKTLIAAGREVLASWRCGDTSRRYPPGLFPPSVPKVCNIFSPEYG